MPRQTIKKIFSFIVLSVLLIASGWYANDWYTHRFVRQKERLVSLRGYKYISPLIDVELPEGFSVNHEPIPFKHKIEKLVQEQIKSGKVFEVSVYYRDLLDGPWFGINEQVKYNPASMMKVPIMIGWLKRAEKDPSVLLRKLTFDEKNYHGPPQTIKPEQALKTGVSYTVEELLRYMMHFSDNRAMWLLYNGLTDAEYVKIFSSMDVDNDATSGNNLITAHGFSGFFRILFNASFLNKEMSEKALRLMSFQDFPYGIAAGIPKGVRLSSKFGEYSEDGNSRVIQLHEFGIVYHPYGPYVLGILTKGSDWVKQAEVIKVVSEAIYNSAHEMAP